MHILVWSTVLCYLLTASLNGSSGAKILGLFIFSSKSMRNMFDPLLEELERRGHEITVVSPVPTTVHNSSVKIRYLTGPSFADRINDLPNTFELRERKELINPFTLFPFLEDLCRSHLEMPEVQNLVKEHFDIIIVNVLLNECSYGLASQFNAPIIGISPQTSVAWTSLAVGSPAPPSFVPLYMNALSDKMTFIERIENFYSYLWFYFWRNFYYNPKIEGIYRDYFPNATSVSEFEKDFNLILMNSHPVLNYPRPLLPNMIEVGGLHCRPAKALPQDLEEFVQGSGDAGFIYFSMGSILQGSTMPEKYRQFILNTFRRLDQRVIWKWETEEMDDLPSNVKLSKWLPQQDVVGHPKIRLFITHGGLLSTEEAVYHGTPLLGIPIFSDQDLNMKQAENHGYALTMEFGDLTEEIFYNKIRTILDNDIFMRKAKYLSEIFRDQTNPLDKAVYWVEYFLRHKSEDARLIQSSGRNLNFVEYYSIDVMITVLFILILGIMLVFNIMKIILTRNIFLKAKSRVLTSIKRLVNITSSYRNTTNTIKHEITG